MDGKYPRFFLKKNTRFLAQERERNGTLYFKDDNFYKEWREYSPRHAEELAIDYVRCGYWEEITLAEAALLV